MLKLPNALLLICRFLAGALLLVVIFASIHLNVQQTIRSAANDPQIELAQSAIDVLSKGVGPNELMPDSVPQVDMANMLTPFILIYDAEKQHVAGNGRLDGQVPVPPHDVFDNAKTHGESRLTWHPKPGVHTAIVVRYMETPEPLYVLTGRSLREVEARERNSLTYAVVGLGIALAVYLLWAILGWRMKQNKSAV